MAAESASELVPESVPESVMVKTRHQSFRTSPISRFVFLLLWPLTAGFMADLILITTILPDQLSPSLTIELVSNMLLQSIAFTGLLTVMAALLEGLARLLRSRLRENSQGREVLPQVVRACLLAGVLFAMVSCSMFTRHRFNLLIPSLFSLAMLAAIPLQVSAAHNKHLRHQSSGEGPTSTLLIVLIPITIFTFVIITGESLWPLPFKYLREPIVLVIIGLHLLYLLWVIGPSTIIKTFSARRLLYTGLTGLMLFITAGTCTSLIATARSEHAMVTSLEVTRSYRHTNRLLLRHLPLPAETITRLLPGHKDGPPQQEGTIPTGRPSPCSERLAPPPRAQSALILTFDSLRADLFGMSDTEAPGFSRLRAASTEYTRFYQTGTVTMGSMYTWRTGRYAVASDEHRVYDAFSTVADQVPMALERIEQNLDLKSRQGEDAATFMNRTIGKVEQYRRSGERFIIHAHNLSLHVPAGGVLPEDFHRRTMHEIDNALEILLDYVNQSQLANNTLVIVSADHGDEMAEERGYRAHGYGVSETLLHTPFFVLGPGLPQGTDNPRLSSSIDVVPTILEGLGLWCHYSVHGLSMLPRSPNRSAPTGNDNNYGVDMGTAEEHSAVCASSSPPCRATLVRPIYSDIHACISWPWKLVYNRGDQTMALYNLEIDRHERNNLADSHEAERTRLLPFMDRYLDGTMPEFSTGGR